MAELRAAANPPRIAREPPVKNPAVMALYGSSFFLIPLTAQSNVEKRPPQTPKLPLEADEYCRTLSEAGKTYPRTGARALMLNEFVYQQLYQ